MTPHVLAALSLAATPLPSDHQFAWGEMTAPPGVPVAACPPGREWHCRLALLGAAVRAECWSPTEYCPAEWDEFVADARAAYWDTRDCPPLSAALNLPDRSAWAGAVARACRVRYWLEGRMDWEQDRAHRLREAVREVGRAEHAWNLAGYVSGGWSGVAHRRRCLSDLRDLIGPEAFERGELPDVKPSWVDGGP